MSDTVFAGSIPHIYETLLVPLIFESYAQDLAARLSHRALSRVLEIAAGTGVVTRALASGLNSDVSLVATDLNQAMLDQAAATGTARPVEWKQASAAALPFRDNEFDAVVCQFGVMFFPDKSAAFAEARRVLRLGGLFLFNVWDLISENEFADTITNALESMFPRNPPLFLARIPHGYHHKPTIKQHLAAAGFSASPQIETVAARSKAPAPGIPAIAYCQGTPLRNEIEAHGVSLLDKATAFAEDAISLRFGRGAVDGKIQAHVVAVES